MNILELIEAVGAENIIVQNFNSSVSDISLDKRGGTKVTLYTNQITPANFLMGDSQRMGLILWFDKSRLPQ